MARDQGLDSFPASACEVKSLPLEIVLFGRVPCKGFPPFPGISHDFPAFPRYPPPPRIRCPGCEAKFRARLESGRSGASRTSYSRPLSRWQRVGVRVRSMARTVHSGTEALQSFFSAPAWIAWRREEKTLPCFRIRQQGEYVRNTRRESRITAFTVQRSSGIYSGANQAPSPGLHESRITRHETRLFPVQRGCERVAPQKTAAQSLFSSSPLFTIVRYCSPLFGKKILPSAGVNASSAALGRPRDKRRRRGERQMKPCRERGAFSIALTTRVDCFSPRWDGRIIESCPRSCKPGAPVDNRIV